MTLEITVPELVTGDPLKPIKVRAGFTTSSKLKNIIWKCKDEDAIFRTTLDRTELSFTPSKEDLGRFTFTVAATNEEGEIQVGTVFVKVGTDPDPEPEPNPEPNPNPEPIPLPGTVLWTSGAWNNGVARHLTGHHQFDPHDKTFEVAAGEDRDWFIDGKGNCFASGARTRGYQHTPQLPNTKYAYQISYIPNSTLDNLSFQFFSRHNEGDPEVNRYGGPTLAFSGNSCEFAEEHWHNERNGSDDFSLEDTLRNGNPYTIRIIGEKIVTSGQVTLKLTPSIDFGNGLKEQFTVTHATPEDEAAIKDALYWRVRTNGTAPRNVQLFNMSVSRV